MASLLQVTISGNESFQKVQKFIVEGQSVIVGRTARDGWEIPWDSKISREHATAVCVDGRLQVRCLERAQNSIHFRGRPVREALIGPNEWFQIGSTTFQVMSSADRRRNNADEEVPEIEFSEEQRGECLDRAFSPAELRKVVFRNSEQQMEVLEQLPEKIAASRSDDDLASMLSQLLLEAIPNAVAVAVAHFDEKQLPPDDSQIETFPQPLSMRVQTRDGFQGRFSPSRRMILKCLRGRSSILHISTEDHPTTFTVSEGLGWAFCAPIKAASTRGWCLYVSGHGNASSGLLVTEEVLLGDLRFTQMVAQFIGSIHQVRALQEQQTHLSTFFSPKIMEGLSTANAKTLLEPAERQITVLFCDVGGFSKMAEALQRDLLTLLKSVSAALGVMAGGIVDNNGAIADFQGDAALGFWGWPVEIGEGPTPACRAALMISRAFRNAAGDPNSLLHGFTIGMGIAHGRALAGQIGTRQQSKIGVFGPVVNQGARLEGLAKQFNVPICIDERTAEHAMQYLPPTEGRVRRLGRVRPKGMNTAITVFALLPPFEELRDVTPEIIADHEAAVDLVIQGEWQAARDLLHKIPDSDGPRRFLLEHIAFYGSSPPANWDGAFTVSSK